MVETAGGFGVTPIVGRTPMDVMKEKYERQQAIKQEIRKQELEDKGENGKLNTREALELASYKMEDALTAMAKIASPNVCYMA